MESTYYNCEDYADVILTLETDSQVTTIPAHRIILAYWSPFFDRLFRSGFSESKMIDGKVRVTVHISDMKAGLNLIKWMYQFDYSLINIHRNSAFIELAKQWLILPSRFSSYYCLRTHSYFNTIIDNHSDKHKSLMPRTCIFTRYDSKAPLHGIFIDEIDSNTIRLGIIFLDYDTKMDFTNGFLADKLENIKAISEEKDVNTVIIDDQMVSIMTLQEILNNNIFTPHVKRKLKQLPIASMLYIEE